MSKNVSVVHVTDSDDACESTPQPLSSPHLNKYEFDQDPNPPQVYAGGKELALLTATFMLGQLIMSIDTTILSTALPTITTEFNSIDDIGWYGSVYALATIACLPTFAKIYNTYSIKLTFIVAICLFEIGSVICATSKGSPSFIVGRAISGMGQSGLLSGGFAVVCAKVSLQRRPLVFGIIMSMDGAASVFGPPLGGLFTDSPKLGWRFCFWINLPFGVLVALLLPFAPTKVSHRPGVRDGLNKSDVAGTLIFAISMTCLFTALQWGGVKYPWTNARIWACLAAFVIGLAIFILLQIRLGDSALVSPQVFQNRTVWLSCLFAGLNTICLITHVYFLPLYFQSAKGLSSQKSGFDLIPYLASVTVSTFFVGAVLPLIGHGIPLMWCGTTVLVVASGLLRTLTVASPASSWVGYQVMAGSGFGATVSVVSAAVQILLPGHLLLAGNCLFLFSVFIGNALATSIGQNIFNSVLKRELALSFTPAEVRHIISLGATGISATQGNSTTIIREAYNFALSNAFTTPIAASGLALLLTLGMEWWNLKANA